MGLKAKEDSTSCLTTVKCVYQLIRFYDPESPMISKLSKARRALYRAFGQPQKENHIANHPSNRSKTISSSANNYSARCWPPEKTEYLTREHPKTMKHVMDCFSTDLPSWSPVTQSSNSQPSGNGVKDVKLKRVFKSTSKLNEQTAQMSTAPGPAALLPLPSPTLTALKGFLVIS